MNPDVINHIEDEIPEYELLKMLEEVQEEVDAIPEKPKKPTKRKGVAKVAFVEPCMKATFDKTICKMCYRKFMDTNPLATAVFTEADFKIDAETLD